MRNKDVLLKDFDEVKILLQYLYMNKDNHILIDNRLTILKITMDENCYLYLQNTKFPDFPPMELRETTIPFFLGCIEQLKESKAIEFPTRFNNRWEEIETITRATLTLNKEFI